MQLKKPIKIKNKIKLSLTNHGSLAQLNEINKESENV